MNKLDLDYQYLLKDILDNGTEKKDRTGTGTISVFGREIRHKMKDGFPLLTTKKMYFNGIVTELIWFLKGDTNIKYLVENGCNIWNGDAYKKFYNAATDIKNAYLSGELLGTQPHIEIMFSDPDQLIILTQNEFIEKIKANDEFAKNWGDLGPIYGAQWRKWNTHEKIVTGHNGMFNEWGTIVKDQISDLVSQLKTNPDSRRLMVNAWNVSEIDQMTLPPCHYGFQVYTYELKYKERIQLVIDSKINTTELNNMSIELRHKWMDEKGFPRRKITLKWNQRSVDTFLGLPFNIASYGLLLIILAKEVNMIPDELIGSLGDTHIYSNHIEQVKEQIGRELTIRERVDWMYEKDFEKARKLFEIVDYSHPLLDALNVPKMTRVPYNLPTLKMKDHLNDFKSLLFDENLGVILRTKDFILDNYQSHPKIEAPLSN